MALLLCDGQGSVRRAILSADRSCFMYDFQVLQYTVITLNIGTPRPATVVVLNIKQFNFTMK